MKTKKSLLLQLCLGLFLFFLSNSARAQFVLVNNLGCDVKVQFEEYIWGTPCTVCNSGPVTISANSSVTLNGCGVDLCVTVTHVGNNFINWYNHANYGTGCHGGGGAWITGQSSTGQCTGGWSASWSGTSWVIQ
jgi:hypothetical protein